MNLIKKTHNIYNNVSQNILNSCIIFIFKISEYCFVTLVDQFEYYRLTRQITSDNEFYLIGNIY